jgi:predicted TIM-barrel fold metal-dependent hydrolase
MAATEEAARLPSGGATVPIQIVDTDVHPSVKSAAELEQFLPKRWHYLHKNAPMVPFRNDVTNNGRRLDSVPEGGGQPGSDPKLLERQLFEDAGVDIAVLVYHSYGILPDREADAARVAAINEWQAATWLGDYNDHNRYRGSIRIAANNPDASIHEIEKWADHPAMVQVLAVGSYTPAFGDPVYEPVWRACAERGLPVAIHSATNFFSLLVHPYGPPTFYFDLHGIAFPLTYGAHLASLLCSGVFERIPDLKVVLIEGGISWAAALGGHLDRNWRLLQAELPYLTMKPSEYMRRNVRFSTQPLEEPADPESLVQVFEAIGRRRSSSRPTTRTGTSTTRSAACRECAATCVRRSSRAMPWICTDCRGTGP